jgi:hypothetical protein
MAEEPEAVGWNYFNYFTEVEEHFQRARGTGLFLMSPLDWALVESWKNSGIPLEAVLRGIDHAFEKWHAKKKKGRMVNGVAYCSQAVSEEAEAMAKGAAPRPKQTVSAPFELEELRAFLAANAAAVRARAGFGEIADSLDQLTGDAEVHYADLEELEQRLTALEEKMSAMVRTSLSDEDLFTMRRELDAAMRPYRGRMTADQLSMLERQYLDRRIQEKAGLPRLSLFYLK